MKDNKKELEQCYRFGYEYFGPLLYSYIDWINNSTRINNEEKIFFFSRDGYMMNAAYDLIDGFLEHKYVYFSRHCLRYALLYKCENLCQMLAYITKERFISIVKLLKYWGFCEQEVQVILKKYNISEETFFHYDALESNTIVKTIYEDYSGIIIEGSRKQAVLLKEYLHQINFCGKCAIVDIGWHGSMQLYLMKFIEQEGISADVTGYYLGINPPEKLISKVHGYIFEPGHLNNRKEILCFLGGYEKLFQSMEGSTVGYIKNNGIVMPVNKEYEYSNNPNILRTISLWHRGALDYFNEKKINSKSSCIKEKIIAFGKNPPAWGIKMFKDFYIDDGEYQFFVSKKRLHEYKAKELVHAISNSIWKTGF